jgi:two-component system, chemotaxis family, response regulator Rcp1
VGGFTRVSGLVGRIQIKNERELRQIPVFILSTSTACDDISNAYDNHANCYIPKPVDLERLVEMSRRLEAFWLSTAVLPGS